MSVLKVAHSLFSARRPTRSGTCCPERGDSGLCHGASKSNAATPPHSPSQSSVALYLSTEEVLDLKFCGLSTRRSKIREFEKMPFEVRLSWCIDKINEPSLLIYRPGPLMGVLCGLTHEKPDCSEAHLWLAILRRICGQNPSQELRSILKDDPDNRKALLNLCVIPLTWNENVLKFGRHEQLDKMRRDSLRRIETYLSRFPTDPFARLIECQLLSRIGIADEKLWEKLNALYLDKPNYSAVLSTMAVLCAVVTQKASAKDFAREAFEKCPHNWQAALLLQEFEIKNVTTNVFKSTKEYSLQGYVSVVAQAHTVFLSPYSVQDPLWQSR